MKIVLVQNVIVKKNPILHRSRSSRSGGCMSSSSSCIRSGSCSGCIKSIRNSCSDRNSSGKKECGEKCCVITESKQQVGGGPCFR